MENNDAIEDLNISKAVKEILVAILKNSGECQDGKLRWYIKSSKKDVSSVTRPWFYIQISSSVAFNKETFEDFTTSSALFEILHCMHELEDESHLCLESEGNGIHLVLKGEKLEVLNKVTMPKPLEHSTLHLRINQSLLHVMKHCRDVHDYLMQLKVFRPKWNIVFGMKLGDVQSRSSFRVDRCKLVSEFLPPMVTDAKYFLQNCTLKKAEACFTACFRMPSFAEAKKQLHFDAHVQNVDIQLSAISHVIPVKELSESPFIMTVTVYGPGCMPLEMKESTSLGILQMVDWKKLGLMMNAAGLNLKVPFPSSAMVPLTSYRDCHSDSPVCTCVIPVFLVLEPLDDLSQGKFLDHSSLDCTLKQHTQKFAHCIEVSLERALSQMYEKLKTREMIQKRIQSMSKAITKIVSMSNNEDFRRNMLTCMQVEDTIDLGISLESRLTIMSKQKHHSLWIGETFTAPFSEDKENKNLSQEINTSSKKTKYVAKEIFPQPYTWNNYKVISKECCSEISKTTETLRDSNGYKRLPFHEIAESSAENDPERDEQLLSAKEIPESNFNRVEGTPEQAQITESMQELSPFQELAETDVIQHHVDDALNEDPHKLDQFSQRMNDLTEDKRHDLENLKTRNLEDEDIEQCFRNCNKQSQRPASSITTDRIKNTGSCRSYDLKSTYTDKAIHVPVNLSRADFELLKHEDFQSTFSEVSGFIDKTASEMLRIPENFSNEENIQTFDISSSQPVGVLQEKQNSKAECEKNSDEWFDEVLMDVENWLN